MHFIVAYYLSFMNGQLYTNTLISKYYPSSYDNSITIITSNIYQEGKIQYIISKQYSCLI